MKTYSKNEMFKQLKTFLNDNMNDKKFVIEDASIKCKDNWSSETNNGRYRILVSRDYEVTLKVKGL